jgi:hypothetical protein
MAARALREKGVAPPGSEDPEVFRTVRSGYLHSDGEHPWQEVYAKQLAAAVHPAAAPLRAAE